MPNLYKFGIFFCDYLYFNFLIFRMIKTAYNIAAIPNIKIPLSISKPGGGGGGFTGGT